MKKWMLAVSALIAVIGLAEFSFGQPKVSESEPRNIQIDVVVAQVHRAAAKRSGLMDENANGTCSRIVDGAQAQQSLQALAELGLARLVTRPTLLALDGQVAYIHVTDQAAVPVTADDGTAT